MRLTQKQLAEMAGVSIVTIFNALHQPHKVKEETRRRIYALLEQHDYLPDAIARSMVRKRTNIIGVVVPSFEVVYYARMVSAIENKLNGLGWRVLVGQHHNRHEKEEQDINMMREYRVDGLIIRNCNQESDTAHLLKLRQLGLPFVMIDGLAQGLEDCFVGDDDLNGSRALISSLIHRGRRRIACLGFHRSGDMRNSNRYLGYVQALSEHAIPVDTNILENCNEEFVGGEAAMERVLQRTRENPVDAVFAFSDTMALNAIHCLTRYGYEPQKQILVAGYGGYYDRLGLPFPLPSVRQNIEEIAHAAVERLMAEIHGTPYVPGQILIGNNLCE